MKFLGFLLFINLFINLYFLIFRYIIFFYSFYIYFLFYFFNTYINIMYTHTHILYKLSINFIKYKICIDNILEQKKRKIFLEKLFIIFLFNYLFFFIYKSFLQFILFIYNSLSKSKFFCIQFFYSYIFSFIKNKPL